MPFLKSNGKPDAGPMRKGPFGLPACKLSGNNPANDDLLAAEVVLSRKNMQGRLNGSDYDAWLNEEDATVERKQANGGGLDPTLAQMKDEICELLHSSLRIGDGDRLHSEIPSTSCLSGRDRSKAG